MGDAVLADYELFVLRIAKLPFYSERGFLEVEHGATDDACAGACVVHAHVHLIPDFSNYDQIFEGTLDPINLDNLGDLPKLHSPYLSIRRFNGKLRIYHAFDLECQAIRRSICTALGRDDWNWKQFPNSEMILATVKLWRRQLNE
jgi:hypothetical protein